jgi:sugar lactone lactonase YvrE
MTGKKKILKLPAGLTAILILLINSACSKTPAVVPNPYQSFTPVTNTGANMYLNVPTGTITGKITDENTRGGLAGAKVEVLGVRPVVSVLTDAAGNFTLAKVPQGRQVLVVSKKGYSNSRGNTNTVVEIKAGSTATAPQIGMIGSDASGSNAFIKAFDGFKHPRGLAVNRNTNELYVVDVIGIGGVFSYDRAEIKKINSDGGTVDSFGSNLLPTDTKSFDLFHLLKKSTGIGVDAGGNVYVADTGNEVVKKYGASGKYISEIKKEFKNVTDVAVTTTGDVVVSDPGNARVVLMDSAMAIRVPNLLGAMPSDGVRGIATDNGDNIYVIDASARPGEVIKKFDRWGNLLPFHFGSIGGLESGSFNNPTDLAIDNRNGDIYVVDTGNNRVQRFNAEGNYLSEFGQFGSDNGSFNAPWGIAVDKQGFVYIADSMNKSVKKFAPGRAN